MSNATWKIDTSRSNIQVNLRSDDPDVVTEDEGRLEFTFKRSIPIPDDMVVNLSVSNAQIPYQDPTRRITLKQTVQITFYVSIGSYGTVLTSQSAPPSGPWTMPLDVASGVYYWVDVPPGSYTAQSFAWFIDTEVFKQTNNSSATVHPLNTLRDTYMTVANAAGKYWEPHKPHGINFAMNFCDNTYIGSIPRSITGGSPAQPRLEQPIRLTYLSQLGNYVTQSPTGPNLLPWQGLPAGQQAHYDLDMPPGYWDVRAFAWWNDIQSYNLGNTAGNAVSVMMAAYQASGGFISTAAINYMMNWCDNTYYYQGQIICGGSGGNIGTIEQAQPSINWATGAWSLNAAKTTSGIGAAVTTSCGLTNVTALDKIGGTPVALSTESELYMKTLLGVPLTGTLPTTGDINTWIGGTNNTQGMAYEPGKAPTWPKIYAEGWNATAPNPVSMGDPACGWCHYPDYPTNAGDDEADIVQYVAGVPANISVAPNPDYPAMVNSGEIKIGRVEDAMPSIDHATGAWSINCAKLQGGDLWTRGDITQAIVDLKTKVLNSNPIVYEDMTPETTDYMRVLLGIKDGVALPTPGDITTFIGGNAVNSGATGTPASPLPAPREYESPDSALLYPKIYRYANWNLPAPYAEPTHSASLGNPNSGSFPLYPFTPMTHQHNIYVRTNNICGSVDSNDKLHDNILCKIPTVRHQTAHEMNDGAELLPMSHIFYEGNPKYGVLLQQPFLSNITIDLIDHHGVPWDLPDQSHYNISLLLQFIRRNNADQADPTYIETKAVGSAAPRLLLSKEESDAIKGREAKMKKHRKTILSRLRKFM